MAVCRYVGGRSPQHSCHIPEGSPPLFPPTPHLHDALCCPPSPLTSIAFSADCCPAYWNCWPPSPLTSIALSAACCPAYWNCWPPAMAYGWSAPGYHCGMGHSPAGATGGGQARPEPQGPHGKSLAGGGRGGEGRGGGVRWHMGRARKRWEGGAGRNGREILAHSAGRCRHFKKTQMPLKETLHSAHKLQPDLKETLCTSYNLT